MLQRSDQPRLILHRVRHQEYLATLTALIANEEQLMRPVIVKQTVNVLRSGETNLAHDDAAIRDGLADVKTHGHSATGERYIRGKDQSGRQTAGELPFSEISLGH
jgi:hypothetical protein